MSRLYFTNKQQFSVSRRFSVEQRRVAWMLRKHPKKFRTRLGRKLVLVERLDLTLPNIDLAQERLLTEFSRAFSALEQAKRKLQPKS